MHLDEQGFQFICCEMAKFLSHVISELPIYGRSYWLDIFWEGDGNNEPWLCGGGADEKLRV